MLEFQFRCPGIECDACANAIKRSVSRLTGVVEIHVDVDSKTVTVSVDEAKTTGGDISKLITERLATAGFDVE